MKIMLFVLILLFIPIISISIGCYINNHTIGGFINIVSISIFLLISDKLIFNVR